MLFESGQSLTVTGPNGGSKLSDFPEGVVTASCQFGPGKGPCYLHYARIYETLHPASGDAAEAKAAAEQA